MRRFVTFSASEDESVETDHGTCNQVAMREADAGGQLNYALKIIHDACTDRRTVSFTYCFTLAQWFQVSDLIEMKQLVGISPGENMFHH